MDSDQDLIKLLPRLSNSIWRVKMTAPSSGVMDVIFNRWTRQMRPVLFAHQSSEWSGAVNGT